MVTCTNVGHSLNYNSILKLYFLHYILDYLTNRHYLLNLYICIIRHGFCGTNIFPNWLILRYNEVLQLLVTTYSWSNLYMLGDCFLDHISLALILIKFSSFGIQTSPSTLKWTYIAQFKSNEEKLLLSPNISFNLTNAVFRLKFYFFTTWKVGKINKFIYWLISHLFVGNGISQ